MLKAYKRAKLLAATTQRRGDLTLVCLQTVSLWRLNLYLPLLNVSLQVPCILPPRAPAIGLEMTLKPALHCRKMLASRCVAWRWRRRDLLTP